MFFTLLRHSWMSLRRAHYFGRSMGIRLVMAFVLAVGGLYLWAMAGALPELLMEQFPDQHPHVTFFSFLGLLYLSDFSLRFFAQSIPHHRVTPYLHLPLRRVTLARYLVVRSWVTPFNFYLLLLFIPFFWRLIPHNYSMEAYRNLIVALWLLGAVNHALLVYMKTSLNKGHHRLILIVLLVGAGLAATLFPGQAGGASIALGQAAMQGHWAVFVLPLAAIAALQMLSLQALQQSLYPKTKKSAPIRQAGSGFMSRLLLRVPRYGMYWDLEWKLLNRNTRPRVNLYQWPLVLPVMLVAMYWFISEENMGSMFIALLMYSGSFGFYHLQYVFSWESRFFDLLATRRIDLRQFILSKYYFYAGMAWLQFLILLPVILVLRPQLLMLFFSLVMYVTGPVFFMLFYFGIRNSTRMDPNKRAHFNFEGTSGSLFMTILLVYATLIPLAIIALVMPGGMLHNMQILTAITGLVFVATHRWWTGLTARHFQNNKYRNLEKYRED